MAAATHYDDDWREQEKGKMLHSAFRSVLQSCVSLFAFAKVLSNQKSVGSTYYPDLRNSLEKGIYLKLRIVGPLI